jgi:hypothetical protein
MTRLVVLPRAGWVGHGKDGGKAEGEMGLVRDAKEHRRDRNIKAIKREMGFPRFWVRIDISLWENVVNASYIDTK